MKNFQRPRFFQIHRGIRQRRILYKNIVSPKSLKQNKGRASIFPKIKISQESVWSAISDVNKTNHNPISIAKDPLNRELEEAFKKQMIRVNKRVKVGLYSPSKVGKNSDS